MTKKTDINRIPEWENEPDREQFEYKGYRCTIKRNGCGALCGYIDLLKNHPWYGFGYDDIEIGVHGGLTYAQKEHSEQEDEFWRIGFDCSHEHDYNPYIYAMRQSRRYKELSDAEKKILEDSVMPEQSLYDSLAFATDRVYRNIEYVREECRSMVEQAIVAESNLK